MSLSNKLLKIGLVLCVLLTIMAGSVGAMDESDAPESVDIDVLQALYEPVAFDHAMHVEATEDCAVCHHHTTGAPTRDRNCVRCHANSGEADTVSCSGCHAIKRFDASYVRELEAALERYHHDKPGLKGAYHLNCVGCHQEVGGPTGCQDCHARNDAGDQVFRSGEYAPKKHAGRHGH